MNSQVDTLEPSGPAPRVIVFKPADREHLFAKFKLKGAWVKRATPFTPGQEEEARAFGVKLYAAALVPERLTVREWSRRWLAQRTVDDVDNDESRLRNHVLPAIGEMLLAEVRPAQLVDVVEKLKEHHAPRTIRNVYSVIKAMYRDAVIQDLLTRQDDPCILTARQLGKLRDKDLGWRQEAVFARQELELLLESTPCPRRGPHVLLLSG